MVTTLEVEVDTATTQDTSLIASLGEHFSYSPFIVLYHRCIIVFSSFVSFGYLLLVICLMHKKKNQKEQKHFRFLETNAETEVQEF